MDLTPIVQFMMLSILVAGPAMAVAAAKGSKHESSDGTGIFFYPRVLASLVGVFGLFILFLPWLVGPSPGETTKELTIMAMISATLAAIIFAGAIYLWRYRVVVRDKTFTVEAFRPREYSRQDIVRTELRHERKYGSRTFFVFLRTGRRLRFFSLLAGFDILIDTLNPLAKDGSTAIEHTATQARKIGRFEYALRIGLMLALPWFIFTKVIFSEHVVRWVLLDQYPVGESEEEVVAALKAHGVHAFSYPTGFVSQDQPTASVGTSFFKARVGPTNLPFKTRLTAYWCLDAEKRLVDIRVVKTTEAPLLD